jgi:hypothetical protein
VVALVVAFGYPAEPERPKIRKPLHELVFFLLSFQFDSFTKCNNYVLIDVTPSFRIRFSPVPKALLFRENEKILILRNRVV